MARLISRALPLASRSTSTTPLATALRCLWLPRDTITSGAVVPSTLRNDWRSFHTSSSSSSGFPRPLAGIFASLRGFRKVRWRSSGKQQQQGKKLATKDKQVELNVSIAIEEELPDVPEVLSIAEMLRLNAPMAMKIAFDGLSDLDYKTRDMSIHDIGKFEKVELSLMLCNDEFIQKLNKEWKDEDHATDVLSMSQHIPELDTPFLILGAIVISVETAARQAEARGHTLLDERRILMVIVSNTSSSLALYEV